MGAGGCWVNKKVQSCPRVLEGIEVLPPQGTSPYLSIDGQEEISPESKLPCNGRVSCTFL